MFHIPIRLAFLTRVTPNLRTEGARTYSELLLERAAEMGRLAESPTEGNIGDSALAQPGSGQIGAASLKPSLPDPISEGTSLFCKETMRVADRDADSRCHFNGSERAFRQVSFDKSFNAGKYPNAVACLSVRSRNCQAP